MIDMHIHTNNSDGQYKTEEIVKMLKQLKINLFSLTDHDNVDSCIDMEKIILPENMRYIPGVEFSSYLGKYNCHILGYNIEYNSERIKQECEIIKKRRLKKIIYILTNLIEYGIITNIEAAEILNKKGTIGRTDICELLIKKGYGTRQEIYSKYLLYPDTMTHRSNAETIIKIIKSSNGIPILAHPKKIEEEYNLYIEEIIKYFIELGIDGIEVFNSVHSIEDAKRYILIAKKYNLLTTGGSDFHGQNKPTRILGTTTTNHIKIKKRNINFLY